MDSSRQLSAYRRCEVGDDLLHSAARRPLREACEALNLAILCLEGQDAEDSQNARQHAAEQARSFLSEAVTGLNRARIYVPEVFTYTPSVIAASEPDIGAELARLHQLSTRLLWYNHRLLPARRETPMRPEDEAQLALLVHTLARTARAARALRHAWLAAAIGLALLLPLGPAAIATGLAVLLTLACTLQAGAALRACYGSPLDRAPALPDKA